MNVRRRARSDGKKRMKLRPNALPETQRTEARSTFTGGDWSGRKMMICTSSPSAILMSDSARQPDVEMFVIVPSPSISPEENFTMQRNCTRRAFLICRSSSVLMVSGPPSSGLVACQWWWHPGPWVWGSGAGGGINCCPGKMIWPGSRCLARCSATSGW
jgi:hypothetical protein